MKVLATFIDDVFPFTHLDHIRKIGRAIIINEKGEVLLEKIERDDVFGKYVYYETPGGGLNEGENSNQATIREVEEECGLKIEIIDEIGSIEDDYNLIHRHNISEYYLAKMIGESQMHREYYEMQWIKDIVWINIEEAIKMMSKEETDIRKLVYQRERIILEKAKEMWYENRNNIFGMCEKSR